MTNSSNPTGGASALTWRCANRLCNTEQTNENRETVGRKFVSDFFGRNKKQTKLIDANVWHMTCRKDYQRSSYAAHKGNAKTQCQYHLSHLKQQFLRIKLWRPDAKFTIQLQEAAKKRVNVYHKTLRHNGNDIEAAQLAVVVAPSISRKNGKAKPLSLADGVLIRHAEHIDTHFCGTDKNLVFIFDTVLPWVEQLTENGEMSRLPPIEFLINEPAADENIIDPDTNYDRWLAHCDGIPYSNAASKASTSPSASAKTTATTSPTTPATPSNPPKRARLILKIRPPSAKLYFKNGRIVFAPTKESFKAAPKTRAASLPLYVPPTQIVRDTTQAVRSTKRPSVVDADLANICIHNVTTNDDDIEISDSPLIVVPGTPIMARGMVFAASKPDYKARSPIDEEYDDGEESDDSEPAAKKRKL